MPNLMKSAFNQWYRRFALFHPDLEMIRQLSPLRDSWLMRVIARAKRKTFVLMNIEMQFIEKHKILCLDLHRDLSKMEYAPQSEAQCKSSRHCSFWK